MGLKSLRENDVSALFTEENMKEELRKNDAERDMERKWMKINAIGTP